MQLILAITMAMAAAPTPAKLPSPGARTVELLETAYGKCWDEPDPRKFVGGILARILELDTACGLTLIRDARLRLEKHPQPEGYLELEGALAKRVAPHDIELRDLLLQQVIAQGEKSIADPNFLPPYLKARQNAMDAKLLESSIANARKDLAGRLPTLKAILLARQDRPKAVTALVTMIATLKANPPPVLWGVYNYASDFSVLDDLDASLSLEVHAKSMTGPELADHAATVAERRYADWQVDAFTKLYLDAALKGTVAFPKYYAVLAHYDFKRAWALADAMSNLPTAEFPTHTQREHIMCRLIEDWAWNDPEAALAAADQETDRQCQHGLLYSVAKAWVYLKPDQIERIAPRLTFYSGSEKDAREAAKIELARRAKGLAPRVTRVLAPEPKMAPYRDFPRPQVENRKRYPDSVRVLDQPGDLKWLSGKSRFETIQTAMLIVWFETLSVPDVLQVIKSLSTAERDSMARHFAQTLADRPDVVAAMLMLKEIKSPRQSIVSIHELSRKLAVPAHGDDFHWQQRYSQPQLAID